MIQSLKSILKTYTLNLFAGIFFVLKSKEFYKKA